MDTLGRLHSSVIARTAAVLVVLSAMACGSATRTPPTEAESRAYLAQVVGVVLSRRLDDLCTYGSGTCDQVLRDTDPGAVPNQPPLVIGSRLLAPSRAVDGSPLAGGMILELCGLDGRGRVYYSEILVFRERDRLIGKEPVFWIGLRIATDAVVGEPQLSTPACPVGR